MSLKEAARPIVQQLEQDYSRSKTIEILEKAVEIARESMPEGWEAGIGERNTEQQYTKFFYHPEDDMELRVYSDPNEPHTAQLRDEETDRIVRSKKEDSEEEATTTAYKIMEKYSRGDIE